MPSEGPLLATEGTNENSVGTEAWSDPGNIAADDGSVATVDLTQTTAEVSQYLLAYNFGFSIPLGATIVGIQVEANRWADTASIISDNSIKIYRDNAIVGNEKSTAAAWTDNNTSTAIWGGVSDTWGLTITPEEANAISWGWGLSAKNNQDENPVTARVDWMAMTIYYTLGGEEFSQTMFAKPFARSLHSPFR